MREDSGPLRVEPADAFGVMAESDVVRAYRLFPSPSIFNAAGSALDACRLLSELDGSKEACSGSLSHSVTPVTFEVLLLALRN